MIFYRINEDPHVCRYTRVLISGDTTSKDILPAKLCVFTFEDTTTKDIQPKYTHKAFHKVD